MKKLTALALAVLMIISIFAPSIASATGLFGNLTQEAPMPVADTGAKTAGDTYTGDFMVAYNPSTDENNSAATGTGAVSSQLSKGYIADGGLTGGTEEPETAEAHKVDFRMETSEADTQGIIDERAKSVKGGKTYALNATRTYKVIENLNVYPYTLLTIEFKCVAVGNYCYIFTPTDSTWYPVTAAQATTLASEFDANYTQMTDAFGAPYMPNANKIAICVYDLQDGYDGVTNFGYTGGYFWAADMYSNYNSEAMLHIDTYPQITQVGLSHAYSTMTHELQHLLNFSNTDLYGYETPSWLNETMSMAAEELIYPGSAVTSRIAQWNNGNYANYHLGESIYNFDNTLGAYAICCLFGQYLRTHSTRGYEIFSLITQYIGQGESIEDSIKQALGQGCDNLILTQMSLSDIIITFRLANIMLADSGIYGYNGETAFDAVQTLCPPVTYNGTVMGGGAIIYNLQGQTYKVGAGAGALNYGVVANGAVTSDGRSEHVVTFVLNNEKESDESDTESVNVAVGGTAQCSITPSTSDGASFIGWFKDGVPYNLSTPVYEDMTLCARYARPEGEIWNFADLQAVVNDMSNTYYLMRGITMPEYLNWLPVGMMEDGTSVAFTGTFYGNAHTISGLNINRPASSNVGLFAVIGENAYVQNLKLTDVTVTGYSNVGAIAGRNEGDILNCQVDAKVIKGTAPSSANAFVGGIAGYNAYRIEVCSVTAESIDGYYFVGGIAGGNFCYIAYSRFVGGLNMTNADAINANTMAVGYVGGIAGGNKGNIFSSYVLADENNIICGTEYVGGIAGRNYPEGIVAFCYVSQVNGIYGGTNNCSIGIGKNEGMSVNNLINDATDSGTTVNGFTHRNLSVYTPELLHLQYYIVNTGASAAVEPYVNIYLNPALTTEGYNLYIVCFFEVSSNLMGFDTYVEGGHSANVPEELETEYEVDGVRYVLKGYDKDFSVITSNLDVTPIYERQYTLTYIVGNETYKTEQHFAGDTITPYANPEKTGYAFSGWTGEPQTMPAADVTVTGSFKALYFAINYYVDGVLYQTKSFAYGSTITAIAGPEKTGHTFSGWTGFPANMLMPANDIDVHGSFNANTYYVTYYIGDDLYTTQSYTYGAVIVPPTVTAPTGYEFAGWEDVPETMGAGNIVINGEYKAIVYTITYCLGTEIYGTQNVAYGATITPLDDPKAPTGYEFSGWQGFPANMKMPANNLTVTGTLTQTVFTVTFISYDDIVISEQDVTYGEDAVAPATPVREGYVFMGWDGDYTNITANTTINAVWVEEIVITYVGGQANGTMRPTKGVAPRVASCAYNYPQYVFTGWQDGNGNNVAVGTVIHEDITLYAQWAINVAETTIYYYHNGGTGAMTKTVGKSAVVANNLFTYKYMNFVSWNTEQDGSGITYYPGERITVSEDTEVNLFAQWETALITVTYVANNDTDETMPESSALGADVTLATPTFTVPEGAQFLYWSRNEYGTGTKYYPGKTVYTSVKLYAIWGQPEYTITYKANNGVGTMDQSINTVSECGFTRTGYYFTGWNTKTNGTGDSYIAGDMVPTNIMLYAQWAGQQYSVTFNAGMQPNALNVPEATSYTYIDNGMYVLPVTIPTADGMTFSGWTDAAENFYAAGSAIAMTANHMAFTAVWEEETVVPDGTENVAYIGETGYPTLSLAFSAARNMTGDVCIDLVKSVTTNARVYVYSGNNTITLSFAENVVYETTNAYAFYMYNNANLTVIGANGSAIKSEGYGIRVGNMATLSVTGVSIIAKTYGIYNGVGATATISNVNISANTALYNYGVVSVDSSVLNGATYGLFNCVNTTAPDEDGNNGTVRYIANSTITGGSIGIYNRTFAIIEDMNTVTVNSSKSYGIYNLGSINDMYVVSINTASVGLFNGATCVDKETNAYEQAYIGYVEVLTITSVSTTAYGIQNLGLIDTLASRDDQRSTIHSYSGVYNYSNGFVDGKIINMLSIQFDLTGGYGVYNAGEIGTIRDTDVGGTYLYGVYSKTHISELDTVTANNAVSMGIYNMGSIDNVRYTAVSAGSYGLYNVGMITNMYRSTFEAPRAFISTKSAASVADMSYVINCVFAGTLCGASVVNGTSVYSFQNCEFVADTEGATATYGFNNSGYVTELVGCTFAGKTAVMNSGIIERMVHGEENREYSMHASTGYGLYNSGRIFAVDGYEITSEKAIGVYNVNYIQSLVYCNVYSAGIGVYNGRSNTTMGYIELFHGININANSIGVYNVGGASITELQSSVVISEKSALQNYGYIYRIIETTLAGRGSYGLYNAAGASINNVITDMYIEGVSYAVYNAGCIDRLTCRAAAYSLATAKTPASSAVYNAKTTGYIAHLTLTVQNVVTNGLVNYGMIEYDAVVNMRNDSDGYVRAVSNAYGRIGSLTVESVSEEATYGISNTSGGVIDIIDYSNIANAKTAGVQNSGSGSYIRVIHETAFENCKIGVYNVSSAAIEHLADSTMFGNMVQYGVYNCYGTIGSVENTSIDLVSGTYGICNVGKDGVNTKITQISDVTVSGVTYGVYNSAFATIGNISGATTLEGTSMGLYNRGTVSLVALNVKFKGSKASYAVYSPAGEVLYADGCHLDLTTPDEDGYYTVTSA